MKVKNRINWKVIDKLLSETESSPQDLLKWLEWGLSVNTVWICIRKLYKNKYYIAYKSSHIVRETTKNKEYIILPAIITGKDSNGYPWSPESVWASLRDDPYFRYIMISRFKKHYKLK